MTGDHPSVRRVPGVVIPGHQVASGTGDTPYPGGTIALQTPHFAARGLDLSPYAAATLNVDLSPRVWRLVRPWRTFEAVAWSPDIAPETFSFASARLRYAGRSYAGLVYHPHPETKPAHAQPPTVVELLMPRIDGLGYGAGVEVEFDPAQVALDRSGPAPG